MSLSSDAQNLGSITLGKPSDVTITKTAVVHFIYEAIDDTTIPLITWKTSNTLVTGYVPTGAGVAYDNANLVETSVDLKENGDIALVIIVCFAKSKIMCC